MKVLKKGVLDEQAKSNELRETLKEKEKTLRKGELEIDSLTFRNQQLTRRVSVLQDELDALQARICWEYSVFVVMHTSDFIAEQCTQFFVIYLYKSNFHDHLRQIINSRW